MQFKMKAVAAAVALVASFGANATLNNFNDAGPGSLLLSLWNEGAGVSALFDLGLDTASFTPAALGAAGTTIVWDLDLGTVTGSSNVSSLIAGVSGSWASAWQSYSPLIDGTDTFFVFAGDRTAVGATAQYYLSTATDAAAVESTKNTNLLNFQSAQVFVDNSKAYGTHPTAANGGNLSNTANNYQGSLVGTNWAGKAPFTAVATFDQSLGFYALQGAAGNSGTLVNVAQYAGIFSFDAAEGTLTYSVSAVPEPESYAMLLAGLGMLGLIARRRSA